MSASDKQPYYFLNTVARAAAVLELFMNADAELRIVQVAQRLGFHNSVAHRLLATLADLGFLAPGSADGTYRLGVKSLELGLSYLRHSPIERVAQTHMSRLVRRYPDLAVHVAILDGVDIVYQRSIIGPEAVYMGQTLGRRQHAYCNSLGKVLLAYLSQSKLESYLDAVELQPFTSNTITSRKALLQELHEIRDRGWAVDNQENYTDRRCIGAPVRDHAGRVVAALSLAGRPDLVLRYDQETLVAGVQEIAAAISRDLGFNL